MGWPLGTVGWPRGQGMAEGTMGWLRGQWDGPWDSGMPEGTMGWPMGTMGCRVPRRTFPPPGSSRGLQELSPLPCPHTGDTQEGPVGHTQTPQAPPGGLCVPPAPKLQGIPKSLPASPGPDEAQGAGFGVTAGSAPHRHIGVFGDTLKSQPPPRAWDSRDGAAAGVPAG